jgi:hypothetical protein
MTTIGLPPFEGEGEVGSEKMKTQAAVLIVAVVLVAGLLVGVVPDRAFALRCGTDIMKVGENVTDLVQRCGPPTFTQTPRDLEAETWWYDQGNARFMTKVAIFDGTITAIEEEDLRLGEAR